MKKSILILIVGFTVSSFSFAQSTFQNVEREYESIREFTDECLDEVAEVSIREEIVLREATEFQLVEKAKLNILNSLPNAENEWIDFASYIHTDFSDHYDDTVCRRMDLGLHSEFTIRGIGAHNSMDESVTSYVLQKRVGMRVYHFHINMFVHN